MKAKTNNSHQKSTFQPKPLTPEQELAIDLLLQGQTDQSMADTIHRDRSTLWAWKTRTPFFMAQLEIRRQEIFVQAAQRLRNLLGKAHDNIAAAVNDGDVQASFDVLKATGIHGFNPPSGDTNVKIIQTRQVAGLSGRPVDVELEGLSHKALHIMCKAL